MSDDRKRGLANTSWVAELLQFSQRDSTAAANLRSRREKTTISPRERTRRRNILVRFSSWDTRSFVDLGGGSIIAFESLGLSGFAMQTLSLYIERMSAGQFSASFKPLQRVFTLHTCDKYILRSFFNCYLKCFMYWKYFTSIIRDISFFDDNNWKIKQ